MKAPAPHTIQVSMDELEAIIERARAALNEDDHDKLKAAMETLAYLTQELEGERVSVKRLKRLLFGPSSEKTSDVFPPAPSGEGDETNESESTPSEAGGGDGTNETKERRPKRKGHGRNGASAYTGATKVAVPHDSLKSGQCCPKCPKGKLYDKRGGPAVLVRVTAQVPFGATVYELQKLRCNLCGETYTAEPPAGVGTRKYDEAAASMIALLRYGTGLPFNRLERLQQNRGIPLPAGTQWGIVEEAAETLGPVYQEHIRQAAQGEILHNDDTGVTILELTDPKRRLELWDGEDTERTGVFTTGIVSIGGGHRVALFVSGMKHAGENLAELLRRRASGLDPPIQMCDALSRNLPKSLKTILANCIAHGRRKFVDVAENFPEQCRHVLELLGDVYKNDEHARKEGLSADERLRWHQSKSSPLMDSLNKWIKEQFEQRQVEENSALGKAMNYMLNHWPELTLFLRVPGAPLDNNVCERALKKAILHRRNSLFYKTMHGAEVGDLYMTLIYTAELARADPFDYLTELQKHAAEVAREPSQWMPWNYRNRLDPPSDD